MRKGEGSWRRVGRADIIAFWMGVSTPSIYTRPCPHPTETAEVARRRASRRTQSHLSFARRGSPRSPDRLAAPLASAAGEGAPRRQRPQSDASDTVSSPLRPPYQSTMCCVPFDLFVVMVAGRRRRSSLPPPKLIQAIPHNTKPQPWGGAPPTSPSSPIQPPSSSPAVPATISFLSASQPHPPPKTTPCEPPHNDDYFIPLPSTATAASTWPPLLPRPTPRRLRYPPKKLTPRTPRTPRAPLSRPCVRAATVKPTTVLPPLPSTSARRDDPRGQQGGETKRRRVWTGCGAEMQETTNVSAVLGKKICDECHPNPTPCCHRHWRASQRRVI